MSVVIVGSVNQDLVAHVERIPNPGETVLASSAMRSGGSARFTYPVGDPALPLNAAPSAPLVGAGSTLQDLADVLVVNEHDALDISGAADIDSAVMALAARVPVVVVTRGGDGSIVVCGETRREVPAFAAVAVDMTGAGAQEAVPTAAEVAALVEEVSS